MKSVVVINRCPSYRAEQVSESVGRTLELLGGIKKFVRPGSRVLIKPNLLAARPPETAVDTHPEVVRALLRRVRDAGGRVRVGDSPAGAGKKASEVYEISGMARMCREEGVEPVRFDRVKKIDGIPVAREALEADVVISVPKFKTHVVTTLTGAVKNMFGVVPGLFKTHCHKMTPDPEGMARTLVNIFSFRRPELSVMDAVTIIEGDGPGVAGKQRRLGLIMASTDAVSIDAVCARIMGLDPFAIATTKVAHEKELGEGDLEKVTVLGESPDSVAVPDFLLPKTLFLHRVPAPVLRAAGKLMKFRPAVNAGLCTGCGICADGCPVDAIEMKKEKARIRMKECVLCLCCCEICPEGAVSIKKNLFARLF